MRAKQQLDNNVQKRRRKASERKSEQSGDCHIQDAHFFLSNFSCVIFGVELTYLLSTQAVVYL